MNAKPLFLALAILPFLATPTLAQREFGFDNTKPSGQPYLAPEETVKRMKVAPGFEVKLFAAEPDVVNPIAFTIDEKGRAWVLECYEYPSRTPPGKAPRDRIIILEDTDGDGKADRRTVFAEGKDFPVPRERAEKGLGAFDLASGLEVGHGGVFVGAPPYLWFIENKNDKPGKFEVLLSGFGSHDTHETLNTFQWGPDGRLYGLHGVFTQSEVSSAPTQERAQAAPPTRMNAAVWRYDVRSRKFEIFAEGTSNPWGMDFDSNGNCFLCCCVIPHLFHIVPGGIYIRQAGSSYHPYAFGYMKEICDHTHHRESGWAHAGLLCLDNPNMPEEYRSSILMGSIHGCSIKRDVLRKHGSSFIASHAEDFLVSGDKNFRPINLRWGPHGDIYVIDWHDQNPCHQAKPDAWDKERGRVYRIQRKQSPTVKAQPAGKQGKELLEVILEHENPWAHRTAWRLLVEQLADLPQAHREEVKGIAAGASNQEPHSARQVRASWCLARFGTDWSSYKNPAVRVALIRQSADLADAEVPGGSLATLVAGEQSPDVRRELASYAIRSTPGPKSMALVHALLQRSEDANDPKIPQLVWLAYEKQLAHVSGAKARPQAAADKEKAGGVAEELAWLKTNTIGNPLLTDHVVPRVMRRLVASGKPEDLAACVQFIDSVDDWVAKRRALEGLAEGLKGHQMEPPANWEKVAGRLMVMDRNKDVTRLVNQISAHFKSAVAVHHALAALKDAASDKATRLDAIRNLGTARPVEGIRPLVDVLHMDRDEDVRHAAAVALGGYDQPEIPAAVLQHWKNYPPRVRNECLNVLKSRREWARHLLDAVARGQVDRAEVHNNVILHIVGFNDRRLREQIERVWGQVRTSPPPAELEALIEKMRTQVVTGKGDPERGRKIFEKNCLHCHKFEGKGHEVGPDLDGGERSLDYILINVLDPNRVIGLPYYRKTVLLKDGKLLTGILAGEDGQTLTLKGENAALHVIRRADIEQEKTEPKSLMPEGLDKNITPEEFRDLVQYLIRKPQ